MMLENLLHWLFTQQPLTLFRVEKAQREAERSGLPWDDVLAAMTDNQRQRVADVENAS